VRTEQQLTRFICETGFDDIPAAVLETTRNQVLTALGTTIAGATEESCKTVVDMAKELGGRPEASILVLGGTVPAHQAAFANAVMARALDFEDSMSPGAHPGAAIIPAALAAAEWAGGASGADFLAAVAVGTETAIRLNLGEPEYDGFDPTGVCIPFGATAAAAKMMGLSEEQTWNALALAFCRCGGSFQANVDGALAVRLIQGWVAETAVTCARLASRGMTGPRNFLEGIYGYFHLFGRDRVRADTVLAGLGTDYQANRLAFKKFPSCGGTQSATQLILDLAAEEGLEADDVERIEVRIIPYLYKLVGNPFKVGSNPRVDAQFSVRYCVANALLRKASTLAHFEADAIADPEVLRLVERIDCVADAALDARGHTAAEIKVTATDGKEYSARMDKSPGSAGNPLAKVDYLRGFWDCLAFRAGTTVDTKKGEAIIEAVDHLDEMPDVRSLIALLLPE